MNNQMLQQYHDQLDYLRQAGEEFAKLHPKTAGMMRMDQQGSADPMVERMLESFAFLTAKLKVTQAQNQNDLAKNLLNILYPSATLSLPSMTTIQLKPKKALDRPVHLPKGTAIETSSVINKQCEFRTGYPIDLLPLSIEKSGLYPIAEIPETIVPPKHAKSFMVLKILPTHKGFSFDQVPETPLRIYIKAFKQYAQTMTAFLLSNQVGLVAVSQSDEKGFSNIDSKPFKAVGFTKQDLILPINHAGFEDCQIFSEFAAYPEKHHYIDLVNFHQYAQSLQSNQIDLYIFFDTWNQDIESKVKKCELCLGCAPIINLFPMQSKPITIRPDKVEYPLESINTVDKKDIEIYKVLSCQSWLQGGADIPNESTYRASLQHQDRDTCLYWSETKVNAWELGNAELTGGESFLTINAPDLKQQQAFIKADMLCTNRDAPMLANLCQDGGEFILQGKKDQPFTLNCLFHVTPVVRTNQMVKIQHIVNLLASSHLNLFVPDNKPHQADDFRKTLQALNRSNHEEIAQIIQHLNTITTKKVIKHYKSAGPILYLPGLEVEVSMQIDEAYEGLLYLFSQALAAFVQHFTPMNSFIDLTLVNVTTGKKIVC